MKKGIYEEFNLFNSLQNENYIENMRESIHSYLVSNELSVRKFADITGLSVGTLNSLLYNDISDCKLSTALTIAKALNITIDELVNGGLMNEITKRNLQICRSLPDNYVHLIRWFINHQFTLYSQAKHGEKIISIMEARTNNDKVIKVTNNFRQVDISKLSLSNDEVNKIFFALQLNCYCYYPIYNAEDLILIANDRIPLHREHVVVLIGDTLFIAECRYSVENKMQFYGIRDGKYRTDESGIDELIGYIVTVVPDASEDGNR